MGFCTLLLDTQWFNAKSFKVTQPHVKKSPLKELIENRKSKLWLMEIHNNLLELSNNSMLATLTQI
tara:strand:- start:329 stop:526 length:198 start_codon:yes stop_codon:yes gene_type:complete